MQHHDSPTDWFYGTQRWKRARAAYVKSVGGLCERCLAAGVIVPGEFVHHKQHLTVNNIHDPTIALSFDNMELLCRNCHAAEHNSKRYVIAADGRVHTKAPQV